jgi:hypothetical protein
MFVASEWIDLSRPAKDSFISDQSEIFENDRIDELDSPECGIHSKQADLSDQEECEMPLKKDKEPAYVKVEKCRPNAVSGAPFTPISDRSDE